MPGLAAPAGQLPGLRRARPPAGARYPRKGPVSRLLPRSRRRPRVVPVSSGESIITTAASTAQGPAASHFLFSAIHGRLHRKQAVIRISQRLSTGLLTACPQATGVSRRTPEPASSHPIGRSFHSDFRVITGNRIQCGHRWLTIRLGGRAGVNESLAVLVSLRQPSSLATASGSWSAAGASLRARSTAHRWSPLRTLACGKALVTAPHVRLDAEGAQQVHCRPDERAHVVGGDVHSSQPSASRSFRMWCSNRQGE